MVQGLPGQELLADKARDSDAMVQDAIDKGMEVVISPKANRKGKRAFDALKYKARHLVENLFQRMQAYRRVATRYEKLESRFLSIVYLVGAMQWLHQLQQHALVLFGKRMAVNAYFVSRKDGQVSFFCCCLDLGCVLCTQGRAGLSAGPGTRTLLFSTGTYRPCSQSRTGRGRAAYCVWAKF